MICGHVAVRSSPQPTCFTVGPGRIHPVYKSIGDFYNAVKSGSKRVTVMGNYSHYRDGEFIKYNDGKLGEKAMVDVLKGTTGVEFKAIQNLSGHGPDGVYIDRSTNPATIYLAEAKSSVHGAWCMVQMQQKRPQALPLIDWINGSLITRMVNTKIQIQNRVIC